MSHRLVISIVLMVIAPTVASAYVTFRGLMTIDSVERFVEVTLERTPIVEWRDGARIDRGWRYLGLCTDTINWSYRDPRPYPAGETFVYSIHGASKNFYVPNADSSTIVLLVKDVDDVLCGRIYGRVEENGHFAGIWQSLDSLRSYPFVLRNDGQRPMSQLDVDDSSYVDVDFLKFWEKFRAAVRARDYRAISSMINLPFTEPTCMVGKWYWSGRKSLTKKQFLRYADQIIDEPTWKAITSLEPLEVEAGVLSEEWEDLPMKGGAIYYEVSFNPYSEFTRMYWFARVGGVYKLAYVTCAG